VRLTTQPVRASADWLSLREPADAAARSSALVEELRRLLPRDRELEVHDLGCGTGSMARWLAPRLEGPQRWVLYDRDAELLDRVATDPPRASHDGAAVRVETRRRDITLLDPAELASADLITASALLDMLTAEELGRLVSICATAGCPVLITLSVTGRVELVPAEALDDQVQAAFNAHQRRAISTGALLGPDAVRAAVHGLTRLGLDVTPRASPWRLAHESSALMAAWFSGWLAAACEQDPELLEVAGSYTSRRLSQIADGSLAVTVHHDDLLARPRRPGDG